MNSQYRAGELVRDSQLLIEQALQVMTAGFNGPQTLRDAMSYSLLAGGKRFRPLLVLASAQLAALPEASVLPMACALEMIHTYSLIHDDLPAMDDDDLRRGKPTSHIVFGEAMAILAGDALLTEAALVLVSAYGGTQAGRDAVAEILRSAGKDGMIGGQVLDILSEGRRIDLATLQAMHRGKTGALITAGLVGPLRLAGSSAQEIETMTGFGEKLGIFFQIQDDVLDVESDAQILGKSIGKDARDEKSTYVSLLGLEESKRLMAQMEAELTRFAQSQARGHLLQAVLEIFSRRDH